MDLSTIRDKLLRRTYVTVYDVMEDVVLIVRNSEAFNGADHTISKRARALKNGMENDLKGVRADLARREGLVRVQLSGALAHANARLAAAAAAAAATATSAPPPVKPAAASGSEPLPVAPALTPAPAAAPAAPAFLADDDDEIVLDAGGL
jgi:hypothetical protein